MYSFDSAIYFHIGKNDLKKDTFSIKINISNLVHEKWNVKCVRWVWLYCLTIVTFFKSKINLRLIKNRNKSMYFFSNISEARRLVYNQCQNAGLKILSNQRRKAKVSCISIRSRPMRFVFMVFFVFLNIHFIYFKYL